MNHRANVAIPFNHRAVPGEGNMDFMAGVYKFPNPGAMPTLHHGLF